MEIHLWVKQDSLKIVTNWKINAHIEEAYLGALKKNPNQQSTPKNEKLKVQQLNKEP